MGSYPTSVEEIGDAVHEDWTQREDKDRVKLIANEPGAQLISEKAHMKELKKLAMAHNIEELLLWKAEVDSSHRRLKTLQ